MIQRASFAALVPIALTLSVRAQAQAPRWVPYQLPRPAAAAMASFDVARDRLVVFGGDSSDGTWERTPRGWQHRRTDVSPPGRRWGSMAYDSRRRRTVLFGGIGTESLAALADTWEWDGVDWTQVAIGGPAPRQGGRLVFDEARGRTLLFGGFSGPTSYLDVWEWDGTAWSLVQPSGIGPTSGAAGAAYDPQRQRTVLVVRVAAGTETWEWSGQSWSLRDSSTTLDPLGPLGMAWLPSRGTVILHGEVGAPGAETWEWDGAHWSRIGTDRIGGIEHRLLTDPLRGTAYLLAGPTVHEWLGAGWQLLDAEDSPPAGFSEHAISTDILRGKVTVFGGRTGTSALPGGWEWDGAGWRAIPAFPGSPVYAAAAAFDEASGRTVMFGGRDGISVSGRTHLWDGSNWSLAAPAVVPSPRHHHAMVYDSARRRVVLFGGNRSSGPDYILDGLADTWEWDGVAWTQVAAGGAAPIPRDGHSMVYDPLRDEIILFGGRAFPAIQHDTWRFAAGQWTPLAVSGPPARHRASLTFDPTLGVAVLHAGAAPGGALTDSWLWDGAQWIDVSATAAVPFARSEHASAWDPNTRSTLRVGGRERHGVSSLEQRDVWSFGDLVPARSEAIGAGCGGPGGAGPNLTSPRPRFGSEVFAIELRDATPSTAALLGLSFTPDSAGLGNGCTLYVGGGIDVYPLTTNGQGFAELPLPILHLPVLRGLRVYAQGFVLDRAPVGVLGMSLSPGLALRLGD